MNKHHPIPGSFRDPNGFVVKDKANNRILRWMTSDAKLELEAVLKTGFLDHLVESNQLVHFEAEQLEAKHLKAEYLEAEHLAQPLAEEYLHCLKHPLIPYISYPFEWCFQGLKTAALFHLDLQIQALKKSVILSDASAYNIQFIGTQPIFIDHLSFKPYQEGTPWLAHHQFCTHFLYPLLFEAYTGLHFGSLYKANLHGIPQEFILKLTPWHKKCSFSFFVHVYLPHWLKQKEHHSILKKQIKIENTLSKKNYFKLLESLKLFIEKLEHPNASSHWSQYQQKHCIYGEKDKLIKEETLEIFIKKFNISSLLDLGCNTGHYSILACQKGVKEVIGVDSDPLSIDNAFSNSYDNTNSSNISFLPLIMDLANPTPNQGWSENERDGFLERFKDKTKGVLALALIHHLRFTAGIPLNKIIPFITQFSPCGIIEFIPKEDPMAAKLLQFRESTFGDYTQDHFESLLSKNNLIVEKTLLPDSKRYLYTFVRQL